MKSYKNISLYCTLYYLLNQINLSSDAFRIRLSSKRTTKKPQPLFNYTVHVLELRFIDLEYSKDPRNFIPGSGVIISRRHVLTAAHLLYRGKVKQVLAYHPHCGGQLNVNFTYAEKHRRYKGKPPYFDLAVLQSSTGIIKGCGGTGLRVVALPKTRTAYDLGGRAILVGHELYYEHFYFTTKRQHRTTSTITTTTRKDPRYYSSEYYDSSSSLEEPCCSTPKTVRLLRKRTTESILTIRKCPEDVADGYIFCHYEQNMTMPHESDIGTAVIDNKGKLIGILSYQRFVTYGTNINFIVDVGRTLPWLRYIMPEMLAIEKRFKNESGNKTFLRISEIND